MDFQHLLNPRKASVQHTASFWRRATAFIIDIILLDIIVTAPFTSIFEGMLARTESILAVTYTAQEFAAILGLFLVVYGYFVVFEYVLGQTPGMMLLGTRAENTEELWRPLVRNSFLLPAFPFVLFWLIEPIVILLKKQSVLERLSSTRTTYTREVVF